MRPPRADRSAGDIRSLTGMRGTAALTVVVYHLFEHSNVLGRLQRLTDHGYIAVDLFFVLSGFVMALSYGEQFRQAITRRDFVDYMWKRAARVYPLYAVVTLLTTLVVAGHFVAGPTLPSLPVIGANVLMMQAWDLGDSICGPAWSLSTEFAAYLLFPAMVLLCARRPSATGVLAFVAVLLLILVSSRSLVDIDQGVGMRSGPLDVYRGTTAFPFCRTLGGFTLGTVACMIASSPTVRALFRIPCGADAIMLVLLVLLARTHADVPIVVLYVPLVLSLVIGRSLIGTILSSRPLHWLGLVSYSLYLVHQGLEWLLQPPYARLVSASALPHAFTLSRLLVIASATVVAALTFHGVERPARDWMRRALSIGGARPIVAEPSAP